MTANTHEISKAIIRGLCLGGVFMLVIGVDPGASGGISVVYGEVDGFPVGCQFGGAWKIPEGESSLVALLEGLLEQSPDSCFVAYLEQVHSMPGQGVRSCFTFGKNYGLLRGVLVALGIDIVDVTPQKWQKTLGCRSGKGFTKTEHKRNLKVMAQEMCPELKVTNATADAILIARYGWNVETGVYTNAK